MKKLIKIKFNAGMTHSMFTQGHPEYSRGMTYVELIVVLSIFAVMTAIVMFSYGVFQAKVDMKNLASEIALKIVEAQKSSISGKIPPPSSQYTITATWKPSYGVYFDIGSAGDPTSFVYFVDTDNYGVFDGSASSCTIECIEKVSITKGNFISGVDKCFDMACASSSPITNPLSVSFKRPDSGATFMDSKVGEQLNPSDENNHFDHIRISIVSPQSATINASINIYPSGRIQVN